MAKLTPVRAIRKKCLDCCCNQAAEVRLCPAADCPLWEYRMGHRPKKADQESGGDSSPLDIDFDL